jgi:hypothetical protein
MMSADYAYFACSLVLLAILINVLIKFDARAWITKGLKRGDLYSLTEVASGIRPDGLTRDQAERLAGRGMVRTYGRGNYRATIKGRLALRIRQIIGQRSKSVA